MSAPTASGIESALSCPASVILPQARGTNVHAEGGRGRHFFLRLVLPPTSMPVADALELIPKRLRAQCAAIRLEDLIGDLSRNIRAEVSYGLHVDTGEVRELGVGLERNYPKLGPRWIVGTLDIEGERIDDAWCVKDVKSGWGDVTGADEGNPQLLFFALVLAALHPGAPIIGSILRLGEEGDVVTESVHEYSAFDLDDYRDRLVELLERIAAEKRKRTRFVVHEGPHCQYCPAFASCPAKTALARRIHPELDAIADRLAMMTAEDAGRAWSVLRRIRPVYEAITRTLKERAAREPLPIGGGLYLRPVKQPRSSFDAAAAVVMLRELGASEEAIASLRRTTVGQSIRECRSPG